MQQKSLQLDLSDHLVNLQKIVDLRAAREDDFLNENSSWESRVNIIETIVAPSLCPVAVACQPAEGSFGTLINVYSGVKVTDC